MNRSLFKLARIGINSLPRSMIGRLVSSNPFLVPYLDQRDILITLDNCYYGRARLILSTRYRIERILLYTHAYDEKTLLCLMRVVSQGDVCIDVGANIGAIALSLAYRVGEKGRVYAFEPGPTLCARLQNNVEATRLPNVEVFQNGLGRKQEILFWQMEEGENAGNAIISRTATPTQCRVYTLDGFLKSRGVTRIDFIKIDVEGMELDVVEGAREVIRQHTPILLVETRVTEGPLGESIITLLQVLSEEGYEFWDIDVAQSELQRCSPEFNFVPCDRLAMPQNTLCVHVSKRSMLDRDYL